MPLTSLKLTVIFIVAAVVLDVWILIFPHVSFTEPMPKPIMSLDEDGRLYSSSTRRSGVPVVQEPTTSEVLNRLPVCVGLNVLLAIVGYYVISCRRTTISESNLLPIQGDPIKGELLMPVAGLPHYQDEGLHEQEAAPQQNQG